MNEINKHSARSSLWRIVLLLALSFTVLIGPVGCAHRADESVGSTVVYLVRHAEKLTSEGRDPALSQAGLERAEALAKMLHHVKIDVLLSSGYQRTRQTLAPLAEQSGLAVQTYDAGDSAGLIERVLTEHRGKTIVIAGHSNTVPELVSLLAGTPGSRGDLAHQEYDRLYAVVLSPNAKTQVLELAFSF